MSEEAIIKKWNHAQDGMLNDSNMSLKLKSMGYTCCKYIFPPGTDFPDHTHNISKMDAITSGKFQMEIYGKTYILEPGDMIEIPKNTVHNAKVVGTENVTFFDSTK